MKIYLNMTNNEYLQFKKIYPLRISNTTNIYFENNTPYFNNKGMCVGLPEELLKYRLNQYCNM
jgi:hypothetical protein